MLVTPDLHSRHWSSVEYLYIESSDIGGPEFDGHVTPGAILFHTPIASNPDLHRAS